MGTFVVGAIVFGLIGLAAYKTYKDRKNGKGCGCGCESCAGCTDCPAPDDSAKAS